MALDKLRKFFSAGPLRMQLAIGGALVVLLCGSAFGIFYRMRHNAAAEARRNQLAQRLRECATAPKAAQSNVCMFAPIESCQRLSIYALDDMRPLEHTKHGVPLLQVVRKDDPTPPRPVDDRPAVIPTDNALSARDLSESESQQLLSLWREQKLEPLEGVMLCDCQPSYGLACADGENLKLVWTICFFCQKIVYESAQPKARGEVLFDDRVPQADELRQELLRLLPHPHADIIDKIIKLKHSD